MSGGWGWRDPSREEWGLGAYPIGLLTFVLIGGTAVLTLPQVLATYAGQEAWIAALVAAPVGLVPLGLLYGLERRCPGRTPPEQALAALGPWFGRVLALGWAVFLWSTAPIVLKEFGDLVSSEALPRTPQVVVMAMLVLVPIGMARQGLEPVSHVAGVLAPLAAVTLLVILLPSLGDVRAVQLLPLTAGGWKPLLQAAAPAAAFYAETSLLGFVLPFRGCTRRAAWRAAFCGLGATALVVAASTCWSLLVFGPLTPFLTSTLFQVTRVASVAEFITHLDALLIAVWVAGGLVKVALWLLALSLAVAQTFGVRDYRALTLPLAAVTVGAAEQWFGSAADLTRWVESIWPFWGLGFEVGLLLVTWVGARIRMPVADPPGEGGVRRRRPRAVAAGGARGPHR